MNIILALKRPFIWLSRVRHRCGYGVHSPFAFELITCLFYEKTPYYAYKELAQEEKVRAIGEIGLDFYYDYSDRDAQRYWFRRQIQLANEQKMPIVIHAREADQEVMDILREEGAFSEERKSWFPQRRQLP